MSIWRWLRNRFEAFGAYHLGPPDEELEAAGGEWLRIYDRDTTFTHWVKPALFPGEDNRFVIVGRKTWPERP